MGPIGRAQGPLLPEHRGLIVVLVGCGGALQGVLRGGDGCDLQGLVDVADLQGSGVAR